MGEARRRKELGLMPEAPKKRPNWADKLTDKEKEEGRKDRAHMLE